jgi:hypothetical protein
MLKLSLDESLLRQFDGVILVGNVAKNEAVKSFTSWCRSIKVFSARSSFFASLKLSHQG